MSNWLERLSSRKLQTVLAAVVILLLNKLLDLGLSDEDVRHLVMLVLGYVGMEGLADAVSRAKGK